MAAGKKQESGHLEKLTGVEEIKPIVQFFIWTDQAIQCRIPSPYNKDGTDKCTSVSYSGGRQIWVAYGLNKSG